MSHTNFTHKLTPFSPAESATKLTKKSENRASGLLARVVRRHDPVTIELAEGRDDRCVLMRGGKPLPRKEVNAYLKWSEARIVPPNGELSGGGERSKGSNVRE